MQTITLIIIAALSVALGIVLIKKSHEHRLYRQLLSAIPDTIFILDNNLQIVNIINPLGLGLVNIQSVIGHSSENFISDKSALELRDAMETSRKTDKLVRIEFSIQTIHGGEIYIEGYVKTIDAKTSALTAHNETENWLLRQSQKKHQLTSKLILEKSEVYRWEYDLAGDKFINNAELLARLGYAKGTELSFEQFSTAINIRYRKEFIDKFTHPSIKDKETRFDEYPVLVRRHSRQDTYEWFKFTYIPFSPKDDGKFTSVIGISICVETTKRNEEQGRITNDLIGMALDAYKTNIWSFDIRTKKFTNLHKRSQLKNPLLTYESWKNNTATPLLLAMAKTTINDSSQQLQYKLADKNGTDHWYEINMVARQNETQKANSKQQLIIGTNRDITEELKEKEELLDYKIKTELAFQNEQVAPWTYNSITDTVTSTSKHSVAYPSLSLSKFKNLMHPDDNDMISTFINDFLCHGKDESRTTCRLKLNGEYRWCIFNGTICKRDNNGKPIIITGIRTDIHEMIVMKQEAEKANRMKSAFIANMSHEIRTPLNAIVGFSDLLIETEDKETRQKFGEIIRQNNEQLLNLVSGILDLSRIESGKLEFIIQDVNLHELIKQWENSALMAAKDKSLEILIDCPENEYEIETDPMRITQVVTNFINNAIKFTEHGSITIGYRPTVDNEIYFYVKDTGCGISKENISKVFGRFIKLNVFVAGTGLGLSISESIIHTLNGNIGVKSNEGEGSEFWFTLPINKKRE